MPYNGAGLFQRIYSWVADAAAAINVDATRMDTDTNDIAVGLSNCVTRDGQSPALANLPMGGFKLTGLANGSTPTDSTTFGQVFTGPTFTGMTATGAINFAGGTVTANIITFRTMPPGTNTTDGATTAFVIATAMSAALPAQTLGFLWSSGPGTATFQQTHTGYAQKEVTGANIASAATINLSTATGNTVNITGATGPVTAITIADGAKYTMIWAGAPTINNSAALLTGTGGNVTVTAGDVWEVVGTSAGCQVRSMNGLATSAQIKTGTNAARPVVPSTLLAALGFSAYFQTADQTITSAGSLTIAHGLGRNPIGFEGFLKCTTAELGYSIGDITPVGLNSPSGGATGAAITSDATNVFVRYGSAANAFGILNKTTGAGTAITNGSWSFFVRVRA